MAYSRRRILQAGSAAMALAASGPLRAAPGPELARILVGFPPGTTTDVVARKIGDRLVNDYAPAVVVESRLGAGGQLAVVAVKAAAPDGASILVTPMSMLGVYPFTYRKLPYDPAADLAPVSMAATLDCCIAVGPAVPEQVRTVNDLMAWYKAHPDRASMGSPATGSTLHFAAISLGRAAGVEITHIGYKGSGAAITDMIGGNLPALCSPLGTFLNQPRLRLLATTGSERSRFTPKVPTLVEQGFKNMVFQEWYGVYLPAGAPAFAVQKLHAAVHRALASKEVEESFASFGMEVSPSTPAQLTEALRDAQKKWEPIVKSIGFSADS